MCVLQRLWSLLEESGQEHDVQMQLVDAAFQQTRDLLDASAATSAEQEHALMLLSRQLTAAMPTLEAVARH